MNKDILWKPLIINNQETLYEISEYGDIRNIQRNKILKPQTTQYGYKRIILSVNKKPKNFNVHRLVAQTFLEENVNNLPYVNHKDGNKENNHYSNLEWVTPQENSKHAWDTGLNTSVVNKKVKQYDLKGNFIAEYDSLTQAARKTDSLQPKITECCKRNRESHNNFQWRYSNDKQDVLTNAGQKILKSKKVCMYDLEDNFIKSFNSTHEAAKYVNGTQSAISRVCNGKNKTHKGYKWKFQVEEIVQ